MINNGVFDGNIFDLDGRLYLSGMEEKAIKAYTIGKTVGVVVKDPLLEWPDSFSIEPDELLYVTTFQINLGHTCREAHRKYCDPSLPR